MKGALATTAMGLANRAFAQGGTLRGVTADQIIIGQTNPYTGPASVYAGWSGKVALAYAEFINANGGINGRKLKLLSEDDGYQPPRTLEVVRRLVERDNVAVVWNTFGTAPSEAIKAYLSGRKVPVLCAGTSAAETFADPEKYPYAFPFTASARMEAIILGKFIAKEMGGKKIGILYQQDDIGEGVRAGLRLGLGEEAAKLIVSEQAYNISDPTIDSQVLSLRAAGAEIFYNSATVKHAAQAIKKANEIGWDPATFILNSATGVLKVLSDAQSKPTTTLMTTSYFKSPIDSKWDADPAMVEWKKFMADFYPDGDPKEPFCVLTTVNMQCMLHILKACGDDLTSENIIRVATSMKDVELPLLLPGIKLNTSPTDYLPIQELQIVSYKDENWEMIDDVISAE
jgi:ABC-type branched-subunit amino acid transport system substrate-binding protein